MTITRRRAGRRYYMDEAASRPPIATRQMNITERSSKDDIIGAACEITDAQQMRINQLQQEQQILFAVVVALLAKILLF